MNNLNHVQRKTLQQSIAENLPNIQDITFLKKNADIHIISFSFEIKEQITYSCLEFSEFNTDIWKSIKLITQQREKDFKNLKNKFSPDFIFINNHIRCMMMTHIQDLEYVNHIVNNIDLLDIFKIHNDTFKTFDLDFNDIIEQIQKSECY